MTDFYDGKRILVTGGNGFLGRHLVDALRSRAAFVEHPSREFLDLTDFNSVDIFAMRHETLGIKKYDLIFHLAADVGGIHYNINHSYDLVQNNTLMALNAISLARRMKAHKLVCAGSVCAYPKNAPVPTVEENLYEGYPEESNGAYGNAKRIMLEAQKAAWAQYALPSVHLVSANLYGPGDNFNPKESHVIPGLIVRIQEAIDNGDKELVVWGTGNASRDFLYVEDAARAYLAAGEHINVPPQPINIASGQEVPIHYLVSKLCVLMGFNGKIVYDIAKPDGQPRRAFRTDRMKKLTGWKATTSLDDGLENTVDYYLKRIYRNHR